MSAKLKKGDTVTVISGKYKGKSGQITKLLPKENKAVVQGVNVAKRHTKPSQTSAGGILEIEKPIELSNLAYLDPKENKPTRIGFKTLADGKKVRVARRSGEVIDQ